MKTINISRFADFLIAYFELNGNPISHLKLQKLLYYNQAWSLAYFSDPLYGELPEAWINGPVYTSIYERFKGNMMNAPLFSSQPDLNRCVEKILGELCLDPAQKDLMNSVLYKYGDMDSMSLVYLTHKEDPWNIARAGKGPFERSNNPISKDTIETYYKGLLEKAN